MSRLVILVCCLGIFVDNSLARRARIIDGDAITIENAPYQISLIEKGRGHVCGGSIISKDYVLTAGHCADSGPANFTVRSGSTYSNEGGVIHEVVEVTRHEDYYEESGVQRPVNDVALLKVQPPFELDSTKERVIELVGEGDEVRTDDKGFITGWGVANETAGTASKQLMSLEVQVMDYQECRRNYEFLEGEFPVNNFCAKHPSGKRNSCQGDSGGPLVIGGRQAGIVSWGPPFLCTLFGLPSVYLDVDKYRRWIDERIA